MPYNYPKNLSYGALVPFLDRTWHRNTTGGGFRKISASGIAHHMFMGEGGESFVRIAYQEQEIVDLNETWLEVDLSAGVRSVPMLKLLNRILEDNGVPYFIPTYANTNMICYTDGEGVALDRVVTARYYFTNGRFTVVNGRTIPDYRLNKEDN